MRMWIGILALSLVGCAPKVLRDATTFRVETMAALARQQEARGALFRAAHAAAEREDYEGCVDAAEPALLLEAAAEAHAYRALWLAGLSYPVDGTVPPNGTEQPDPGPMPPLKLLEEICGGAL